MTTTLARTDEKRSAVETMARTMGVEADKVLPILKSTVIKPTKDGRQATDGEVAAFMVVANRYGLDPFTREIHAFADPHKGIVPIVGIDGWAAIVNREPGFDGCEFDEVVDASGQLVAMSCTMHVKHRNHPVRITEYMRECKRNTPPWQQMPARMLRHKAFMQAARLAFSISGLYDDDEARDIVSSVEVAEQPKPNGSRVKSLAESLAKRQLPEPKRTPPPANVDAATGEVIDAPPPAEPDAPPFDASPEPAAETTPEPQEQQAEAAPLWTLAELSNAQDGDWARTAGIVEKVEAKGTTEKPYKILHLWEGANKHAFSVWDKSADTTTVGSRVELDWKAKAKGGRMYFNAENVQVTE